MNQQQAIKILFHERTGTMIKETKYPGYFVDEYGNVYSNKRGKNKKMKPIYNGSGYYQIKIFNNNKCISQPLVHRLVWETFNGAVPDSLELDHIDRNTANNTLSNLRVVTHSENLCNRSTNVSVMCVNDGHLFKTMSEAELYYGINPRRNHNGTVISNCLSSSCSNKFAYAADGRKFTFIKCPSIANEID